MGYFVELQEARRWLTGNKAGDGGWGLAAGSASSLVNTAEALFVLSKAGAARDEYESGLAYLLENVGRHLEDRGPRTRYVSMPLHTLATCFPEFERGFCSELVEWLLTAQNSDDGWGAEHRDGKSDLFSTYLAIEALAATGACEEQTTAAGRWVLAQARDSGWRLAEGGGYSITGTAYAIQALSLTGHKDTGAYKEGHELLLATDAWHNDEVVIPGTRWHHCRAGAVAKALAMSDTTLLHPTIAEAMRSFQRRLHRGAGWTENEGDNQPTIRSQYWAASALSFVWERLDPAIYIPRADAERAQGTLQEPQFLPFFTGSTFHTILPAGSFRLSVWALLVIGLGLCSGIASLIPAPPAKAAPIAGVGLLAVAWWAVTKRPKQFPRLHRNVRWIVVLSLVLGALYGLSAYDIIVGLLGKLYAFVAHLIAGI